MMAFLLGVAFLLASASAQFVSPPTDLTKSKGFLDIPVRWKKVPEGTCELTPGVKSYSGYVDVFEDQHIFFWFFEARNANPEEAPLTVWLNGGPGSSSMIGLFQELGPCKVNSDGEVYDNPYAWNNITNMMFIDHPAQVGFSYSTPFNGFTNGYDITQLPDATCPRYAENCGTFSYPSPADTANSTINAAPSFWRTIQGFMGAFPQYSRGEFNFASESYGGHYGPIFNAYIESQNDLIATGDLPGAHHINLATLLIGNGWFDPPVHYASYYNYTVDPGNPYDYDPFDAPQKAKFYNAVYGPGNCLDRLEDCKTSGLNDVCTAADEFCADQVEIVLDNLTNRDEYDIRELEPDPFPYEFYKDYLNTPKLQKAIGAFVNFSSHNDDVSNTFVTTGDDARDLGTVAAVRKLVNQGVYVVMYNGDADYNCNYLGNEVVALNVQAPNFHLAGYENISTTDFIVHGQVKQSSNFAFARIYHSGHLVPFYQPLVAIEMFDRAISGLDIASGTTKCFSDYRSVGTPTSTYREGKSTVQFKVLPADATYNTTTNAPNPPDRRGGNVAERNRNRKRSKRAFKPSYGYGLKGRR